MPYPGRKRQGASPKEQVAIEALSPEVFHGTDGQPDRDGARHGKHDDQTGRSGASGGATGSPRSSSPPVSSAPAACCRVIDRRRNRQRVPRRQSPWLRSPWSKAGVRFLSVEHVSRPARCAGRTIWMSVGQCCIRGRVPVGPRGHGRPPFSSWSGSCCRSVTPFGPIDSPRPTDRLPRPPPWWPSSAA
jgi:hypothetical protein